jgi:ribonuclease HI
MEYWCDGGVNRYCITDSTGRVIIEKTEGTSNEQEYKAMIHALELAQDGDTIYADSQLVVSQLTKNWKVKAANLYPFYCKAIELYKSKKVNIEWVSRDFNRAGWILEK